MAKPKRKKTDLAAALAEYLANLVQKLNDIERKVDYLIQRRGQNGNGDSHSAPFIHR
ncbi:MAG: hypothetical protein ACXWJX_02390 [Limisphaerales bacterium]